MAKPANANLLPLRKGIVENHRTRLATGCYRPVGTVQSYLEHRLAWRGYSAMRRSPALRFELVKLGRLSFSEPAAQPFPPPSAIDLILPAHERLQRTTGQGFLLLLSGRTARAAGCEPLRRQGTALFAGRGRSRVRAPPHSGRPKPGGGGGSRSHQPAELAPEKAAGVLVCRCLRQNGNGSNQSRSTVR